MVSFSSPSSGLVFFFFFSRRPELPALMKIRKAPGMPGGPGVIAHGPVGGEPPTR